MKPSWYLPWTLVWTPLWLARLVKKYGSHVIHSFMSKGAVFGARAAKWAGVPHLWFQHGPVTGGTDRKAAMMSSRMTLVNSSFTEAKQRSITPSGYPFSALTIYPGVDFAALGDAATLEKKRQENRERWKIKPQDIVIGMVCRLQPQKGVHLFLEGMRLLQERLKGKNLPYQVRGVVLGGKDLRQQNTAYEKQIRIMTQDPQYCTELVPLMNDASEVFGAISAMDIVANCSVGPEGFGLSLVEAMALAKIPVGPKEGGPVEIIEEGKTGFFFEPRNPASLAEALEKVILQPEARLKVSKSGAALVRLKFNARNSVSFLEECYREILDLVD